MLVKDHEAPRPVSLPRSLGAKGRQTVTLGKNVTVSEQKALYAEIIPERHKTIPRP